MTYSIVARDAPTGQLGIAGQSQLLTGNILADEGVLTAMISAAAQGWRKVKAGRQRTAIIGSPHDGRSGGGRDGG